MPRNYANMPLDEFKERVLATPLEDLTDSEKARCLKKETLREMDDEKLIRLQMDKRFDWLLTCDKIRYATKREKLYYLKKNLLRSMYNNQLIEREISRRQVPLNGSNLSDEELRSTLFNMMKQLM